MLDALAKFVNVFFNDPGDAALKYEQGWPSASIARFQIPGWSDGGGDFQPGTKQFESGQLGVILSRTYDSWEHHFGAPFEWQPGGSLPIVSRAGHDLNAYYDRTALKFFYDKDVKSKQMVYACESCDVAAHECGHAVLDAHHPDYWDSLHPETGAFHEAFGDMSALLTTLEYPSVRAAMLKEHGGDLTKSNGISRLAEQLGRALYDKYGPTVCARDYLRDLVNKFRYTETWKLPASAPASKLSSESHNFSRVFSGAFYEILAGIYTMLRQASPSLQPDDALSQARDEAGKLLARGLLLAPPGDAVFQVIAASMFKADQQDSNGKYFPLLRSVFTKRRIIKAKDANVFQPHTQTTGAKTQAIAAANVSAEGIASDQMPPEVIQKALRLRGQALTFGREIGRPNAARTVHYRSQGNVRLKGKKFGVADGAVVPVQSGLSLNINQMGMVASSQLYTPGTDGAKAVRDHVEKLARKDRIYDRKPGDELDMSHLITKHQPYFIDYDQEGNKVLRRAFIACGCE